jgi:hypothetical protein
MLRRREAARGSIRLGRLRLPRLIPPTFFQALETYGFLYRACKNVIYSRNVMCHAAEMVQGNLQSAKTKAHDVEGLLWRGWNGKRMI